MRKGKWPTPNLPSAPVLRGIGRLCVEWSALEENIGLQASLFLPNELTVGEYFAVFSHIDNRVALDILSTLASGWIDEAHELRELRRLIKGIRNLNDERNRVIHGHWTTRGNKTERTRISARGELKKTVTSMSAKELDKLCDRVTEHSLKIADECERLRELLPSQREFD